MIEDYKRDVLRIIVAMTKAKSDPTPENMKAAMEALTNVIGPLNVAHAFMMGAAIASGGVQSGCEEDVYFMMSLAETLGDKTEELRARMNPAPKGSLLN